VKVTNPVCRTAGSASDRVSQGILHGLTIATIV
jgi:hypothetical protein